MSDLLPILEAIDRRIGLDEALAMRRVNRPRLSQDRCAVWRRTRAARFWADPIICAAIGDTRRMAETATKIAGSGRSPSGAGARWRAIAQPKSLRNKAHHPSGRLTLW